MSIHYINNNNEKFYMKNYFIIAAGLSLLLALYLWFSGQTDQGMFVGLWVPSILSLGALLKK